MSALTTKKLSSPFLVLLFFTCFFPTPSLSRSCYYFDWTIYIYNAIPNSVIDVHVKSKDDDLGHHNITGGSAGYNFGFCENFFDRTLFAGDFVYGAKSAHFHVFDKDVQSTVGRSIEHVNYVFWALKEDGYYLSSEDKPFDDPAWVFRGHWE